MTIHKICTAQQNAFAETALPFAPKVTLSNGHTAVPQQYLKVERCRESVENIVSKISFADDYLLFVGEDNGVIYIQAGVIGRENYPKNERHLRTDKIVYGRKWLIEVNTPSSEVIQTALLALKKVREHEVREKIFFRTDAGENTTPFNTHLDLPLMAANQELFPIAEEVSSQSVANVLSRTRFSQVEFKLHSEISLPNRQRLLIVRLASDGENHFPELLGHQFHIVLPSDNNNTLAHEVCNALISESDRYVEENFEFDGYKRFSHNLNVESLAEFSAKTRNLDVRDPRFVPLYKEMTYQVDADRAPPFAITSLAEQQRQIISNFEELDGHLPKDSDILRSNLIQTSNS